MSYVKNVLEKEIVRLERYLDAVKENKVTIENDLIHINKMIKETTEQIDELKNALTD